jgi:nicotinamide-nucleotide amidase
VHAAILAIGDELVLGQRVDTNSAWLSARLVDRAVEVREQRTVADDRGAIAAAIARLAEGNDLLLITGGLGPTADDLTREALGDVVDPGEPLVRDEREVRRLERRFATAGRAFPETNLKQAERPPSMAFIENRAGTAPGLSGEHDGCLLFAMPGPPREMHRMFEDAVVAALPEPGASNWIATAIVRCYGLGESEAAERIAELMGRQESPLGGTTASSGIISARIRARGPREEVEASVDAARQAVEAAWSPYCFGSDEDTLADAVGRLLEASGQTLAVAESCTGGLLSTMLVDRPGASAYFAGGWVTYADAMKRDALAVPAETLAAHGAVSEAVAVAMATGARERAGADWGIGITGIAGPGGEGPDKPAGTVHVALAGGEGTDHRRFRFRGERALVRDRSAKAALQMLRFRLAGLGGGPRLLWEAPVEADAR